MSLMNQFSVKSRLLTLVVFPMVILCVLSGREIQTQLLKLNTLHSLNDRLLLNETISNYITAMHNLRLNALFSNDNDVDKSSSKITLTFLRSQVDEATKPSLYNAVNDLIATNAEINNFSAIDIEEWSHRVSGILNKVYELENQKELLLLSSTINQKLRVITQLQWLNYWATEENWYINLDLNSPKTQYHDELNSLFYRQELYIKQFGSMDANASHIDLLLKKLSNDSFALSMKFRNDVLKNKAKDYSNIDNNAATQALNHRLVLIKSVTQKIVTDLKQNLKTQFKNTYITILLFISLLILSLAAISYLGISLSKRIITYLKNITKTMALIEKNHDYNIQIQVDGKDELASFSQSLNSLVFERAKNEKKIILAKNEAEQANLAKSSFLANMSHEIRTPLNGIIGISGILSETKLSPIQHDYLNTIETSSQTLLILISDILDISKIEAGNLALHTHNCNLREIIFDIVSIGIPKATEKNLELIIKLSPNLPDYLLLDDHRIRQILMNLTSNAIKFTHQGSITISADFIPTEGRNGYINISVSDTGIGIEKEAQAKIFKPFIQEDSSITRQYGGTGLGLAITQQLIGLMGGKLILESKKGHGSTFSFSIKTSVVIEKRLLLKELDNTSIILLNNGEDFEQDIENECRYHNLLNVIKTNSPDGINLMDDEKAIILYCINNCMEKNGRNNLINLREKHPNIPIILIQKHKNSATNYESIIDGLITYPLLGHRFAKTLANSLTFHFENKSNHKIKATDEPTFHSFQSKKTTQEKQHILIVEDNLVNQKVASLFLSRSGYTFDIANNGQEAIDKFTESEDYELILMDCMMPVKDGFSATKEIRTVEKKQRRKKIPIIALTASVLDQDISKCYESGMDDYVAKPFKKEVLLEKIIKMK
ncbi:MULTISPECIES: ATP-binding protein [Aliivibrio]|uniref:Sensory/regulatory protein RpfC n=1 Tax=Aliivibrio finisterrensis TaxID=511998 RepID=A0A4Q5KW60_9GAMM|nr:MULTISPECIES: ATP-binding protein [Aliivibrio]MDD9179352.1 ATP-binding protein [Aliivibrio sp. A6]RYU51382.1 response regulator [Aliivibrio finisterrensis]RYU52562.1 response regulator [Aliivibrio finisterrensis]RYU58092.1 response regulator [Aliivibrio finisterrensis]RYU64580.1 response regulator [Aliivibrio finisterrensis]